MLISILKTLERAVIPLAMLAIVLADVPSHASTVPVVTVLTPPVTKNVGSPLRIAFDSRGNFYVTDPRAGGVSKFNASGQLIVLLKTKAPPLGIAINSKGNLLVSQGSDVMILNQSGRKLGWLGSGDGQFKKANGIAVDTAGFAYVVDSLGNNVQVFNSTGQFVRTIGTAGTDTGQFSMPTGIAYDKSTNQIAVADTQNSRVQFFKASGTYDFVKSIGSSGSEPLQFRSPVGVTFEYDPTGKSNRMYVVDTYQNNVQVLDPADGGKFLAFIGSNGLANGQLMAPMDVAFDQLNRRIIITNGSGSLTMFGLDGGTASALTTLQKLVVDPVATNVRSANVVISGKADSSATITCSANTAAVVAQTVYTSGTGWKCDVSSLTAGDNVLTITAIDATDTVSRHSIAITYSP